jgi:hypothetical protein
MDRPVEAAKPRGFTDCNLGKVREAAEKITRADAEQNMPEHLRPWLPPVDTENHQKRREFFDRTPRPCGVQDPDCLGTLDERAKASGYEGGAKELCMLNPGTSSCFAWTMSQRPATGPLRFLSIPRHWTQACAIERAFAE